MLAFHTLCINPKRSEVELSDGEALTMILSALKWRQLNGKINLYTDNKGFDYIQKLGAGFVWNSVVNSLEKFHAQKFDEDIYWASSKLQALREQTTACVMLDLDFIVWKPIDWEKFSKFALVTIHREDVNSGCYTVQQGLDMGKRYADMNWEAKSCNNAFALFNYPLFKDLYVNEVFNCMREVKVEYPADTVEGLSYMVFAEQRLLAMLADKYKLATAAFSDDFLSLYDQNQDMFTHLWSFKKTLRSDPKVAEPFCRNCVERIHRDFYEEYRKLSELPWFRRYCQA